MHCHSALAVCLAVCEPLEKLVKEEKGMTSMGKVFGVNILTDFASVAQ